MEWTDEAIVLSARPHGETSSVAVLLTREHGRHAGLVHGGASGRARALYQPGNRVRAIWRARLAEHLGQFVAEPLEGLAALLLDDPLRLAALSAACAVADRALPEREPHPGVHDGLAALIAALADPGLDAVWPAAYVRWELGLLADLGYGLDLERCAATGVNDQLAYVSPRTGRAVSLAAGEPYKERLLPLPGFLVGRGGGEGAEVMAGLRLSGHFLERNLFAVQGEGMPAARTRFMERFGRLSATS